MKILRYRLDGNVKPGILDVEGNIRDASSLVMDWDNENIKVEKLELIKSNNFSIFGGTWLS